MKTQRTASEAVILLTAMTEKCTLALQKLQQSLDVYAISIGRLPADFLVEAVQNPDQDAVSLPSIIRRWVNLDG